MFIAHIPATYLFTKAMISRPLSVGSLIALSLGAIIPDIDLLRFYLLDNHQIHHHSYWTHRPIIWFGLFGFAFFLTRVMKIKAPLFVFLFLLGACLHMGLDCIVGEIAWFWPFSSQTWPLVHIRDTHEIWILNFFVHWTFLVEVFICCVAILVFFRNEGHYFLNRFRA